MTATVRDRLSGEIYQIRAKYLIGADGGRSKVAQDIGLPMGKLDGHRGLDEHRLRGRPVQVRRAPAERPVLGAPAGRADRRHRRRPGPDGPAVERVADRLGLRHQPARAGGRRGDGDRDRAQPGRRRHHRRQAQGHLGLERQPHVCREDVRRPGVLHGRRDPPAPAEQRPRLEHLDPGRVQPRLEAGAGTARPGVAEAARHLRRGADPDRPADRGAREQEPHPVRADLPRARDDAGRMRPDAPSTRARTTPPRARRNARSCARRSS